MAFKRDFVRFYARTSTGSQTISHNLGETPKCIVFFIGANDYGSEDMNIFFDAGTAGLGVGATDGTTSFAAYTGVSYSTSIVLAARYFDNDPCIKVIAGNADRRAEAFFSSWNSSRFTLNWTDAPADDMPVIAMVLGGSGFEARVSRHLMTSLQSTQTFSFTGTPFIPKGGLCVTLGAHDTIDGNSVNGALSLGFWSENGTGGFHNFSQAFFMQGNTDNMSWGVDDDKSMLGINSSGNKFYAGAINQANSGNIRVSFSPTPTETYAIGLIHFGGIDVVASAGLFNPHSGNLNVTPIPEQRPRCIFTASAARNETDSSAVSTGATGLSIGMADTNNPGNLGSFMVQREELTSAAEISYHASSNYFVVSDENSSASVNFDFDGAAGINTQAEDSKYFQVSGTLTVNNVAYLSLGEVGEALVQQSLSGASSNTGSLQKLVKGTALIGQILNTGSIQTSIVFLSALDRISTNIGSLNTRILDIVSQAIAGVSASTGEIARNISWSLEGTSVNTGTATTKVKGGIQIKVDRIKQLPADLNLGLGDETGFNDILTNSPLIEHLHPDEKVKNLKVKYRKNNRENDVYLHEIERSSSTNGVDQTINLPFVYDHDTADMVLDYKRKRFAAAVKRMSLEVGQDAVNANRSDLATVDIPSLGVSSSWEVTGTNVTPAGSQNLSLVPYSAKPYTYDSFVSEGGTLPEDTGFDIPADISNTPPDPVSNLNVAGSARLSEQSDRSGVLDITWTAPDDGNYSGGEIFIRESSGTYKSYGVHFDGALIEGLKANTNYDVQVISIGEVATNRGLPREVLNRRTGTSTDAPERPSPPVGTVSGRVVTFRATPPISDHPIKNYDWYVDFTQGGSDYTVSETGLTISVTVEGTADFTVRARVRARNVYNQAGEYSFNSLSKSEEQWKTAHIGDNQITNDKLNSLNANKITTGLLTVTGNPGIRVTGNAGIDVTGSGNINFQSGGDIIMKASTSGDSNLIQFRTAGNSPVADLGYSVSSTHFYLGARSGGKTFITGNIDMQGRFMTDLDPLQDSSYDIGTSGIKWRNGWFDFIHGADYCYENEIRTTEPNHVYSWADPNDGVIFMDQDWQPITWIHKDGRIETRKKITELCDFPKSDVPRRERDSSGEKLTEQKDEKK